MKRGEKQRGGNCQETVWGGEEEEEEEERERMCEREKYKNCVTFTTVDNNVTDIKDWSHNWHTYWMK